MNRSFWNGKRVFLTGHTGFKGSWLSLWLSDMGANVYGFATDPPTTPSLFEVANVKSFLASNTIGDIRDFYILKDALTASRADIVLHLAAQPLVKNSYSDPVGTYTVNINGTINLLEAMRCSQGARVLVNVTTDKCYENNERIWPFRENEPLGGYDPYSSSKACSELITAAYRRSFLGDAGTYVATARAGNVIGGGDWSEHRLLPDLFRALDTDTVLNIRSPKAIRPWQHVLEPLSGYLMLAESLFLYGDRFASAWNFGPNESDARSVEWIVKHLATKEPSIRVDLSVSNEIHEAATLKLDSSKAKTELGWRPRWSLNQAIEYVRLWHKDWRAGKDMCRQSLAQIHEYERSE